MRKLTCLHCWKVWKIHELKIVPLVERIGTSFFVPAYDVWKTLGDKAFAEIILGCNEEWVILQQSKHRFVWEYSKGKRLWWIGKNPAHRDLKKFEYELGLIKVWVPISRYELYPVIKSLFKGLNATVKPNKNLSKYSSMYNSEKKPVETDSFMMNVYSFVTLFVRWYNNMYDKVMSEDATDEDFDKFQELLGTWIGDEEISKLESWDRVSLSSLVPAIDYLLSRSVRPSVSLRKQSTKYPNIINDLPSTHPFYDLLHEKPL